MNPIAAFQKRMKFRKVEKELKKIEKEELKKGTARKQTLAFLACPADIQPSKDGWHVDINGGEGTEGGVVAQAMIIGKTIKKHDIRKGYDEDFDNHAVDELLKISATLKVAILYTHIMSPIDPLVEAKMLGDSIKKVSHSKIQQENGEQTTLNSEYNRLNGNELRGHTSTVFNGRDHYYNYGLCAAAFGKTLKDVTEIMDAISAKMDECGIRYEIPRYNQVNTIKSMLPTNYRDPNICQPVSGRIASQMLPLRALNPAYPDDGIIFGVDDTGKPVKVTFTKKDAGHIFCLGKTGSGKTVFECMGAGRALAKGARVIILEPKNEDSDGTDYKNFCLAYGGKLIRIGQGGKNFNPLQVFYDPKIMGTDKLSYQKALSDHYETIRSFFAMWIGPTFKNRMRGYLTKTLIELYKKKGIIDDDGNVINTDKWTHGTLWPSIGDLRRYWEELLQAGYDPSLDALLNNTIDAMRGGPLGWMDNYDAPELDNDLLVLDISNVSLNIQNAFSVLMMGIINTRFFPKPADGTPRRRTFVFFDEGAKLLKINELKPYIEKMFRESRSAYITTGFFTQDTEGMGEDVLNFIKANCSNIFLLCNLKQSSLDPFMKVFNLKEEQKGRLLEEGTGICLYLREPYAVNMDIVLTDVEKKALLESEGNGNIEELKAASASGFSLDDDVEWIKKTHGFFTEEWTEGLTDINIPGWTFYQIQDPFHTGMNNCWIDSGRIKEAEKPGNTDKVLNQGYKHYGTVCMIAGNLIKMGFQDVQIHHYNNVDISAYIEDSTGKRTTIGIEVEMPGTHSAQKWDDKKKAAKAAYDVVIFTCPTEIEAEIKAAVGGGFVFRRGMNLRKKLEKLKAVNPSNLQQVTASVEA